MMSNTSCNGTINIINVCNVFKIALEYHTRLVLTFTNNQFTKFNIKIFFCITDSFIFIYFLNLVLGLNSMFLYDDNSVYPRRAQHEACLTQNMLKL